MRTPTGIGRSKVRGLAMTELAIVLPVALMLILATAELGRAFWQYNTLTKSVRDAARYATMDGLWGSTGNVLVTDELRVSVQNLVVYGNTVGTGSPLLDGLTTSGVTLESPGEDDILVRAVYAYEPIFGSLPTFGGDAVSAFFEFESVVRMRAI